jgi:predicted O-methyltransferase YrrM
MVLDGTPMMSPNCWQAIQEAAEARGPCRYLEWGTGNSTLAMLRTALEDGRAGWEIHAVESDLGFADEMMAAIAETFRRAGADGLVHVEPLRYPKPGLLQAVRPDPLVRLYESQFLKVLWRTRNDDYWIMDARPQGRDAGRLGGVNRSFTQVRCSTGHALHRVRRAVGAKDVQPSRVSAGTVQSPVVPALRSPTRVVFETSKVKLDYYAVPQLRNRIWHRRPILDGLYAEFADYVSAPLDGRFDVVLVDGRARTSCLKRVHHDELLNAGGALFLHDAHRPSHQEALRLYSPWSYLRGVHDTEGEAAAPSPEDGTRPPRPPQVRSGGSMEQLAAGFDRELFFYVAPDADRD